VVVVNVVVIGGGVVVEYYCIFPTIVVAQNFYTVIRTRPLDCFRASPFVVFRQVNVVTVNVVSPGTRS
jgi:hypothetical protein